MKLVIVHDKAGNIGTIAVPAKEFSDDVTLLPGKGEYIAEVDSDDIEDVRQVKGKRRKLDLPELGKNLSQHYRIKQGKLARK